MTNMSIRNVNKVYDGDVHAVKDFSLEIEDGEFIVFVGPSGCGKSTMLRMIAGLETITNGELILKDRKINDVAPADRDIAMVFQNYALFGSMTVYENMGLPLAIRHVNGNEIHLRVMDAARTVEMKGELNRKPGQLSGGQRQRVAIGRSLVRNPVVFLMDEPLSNLDAKLRTQTRKELATLQKDLKTTFIYVTHDQVEAMTLADRIVIMSDGEIQQIGTPQQVYNYPANIFVGGFIGSPPMNFVTGRIEERRFISSELSLDIPVSRPDSDALPDGRSVVLGIRPEHFSLTAKGEGRVKTVLEIVECLGSEYVAYFSIQHHLYRAQFPVGTLSLHAGDEVSLDIDAMKVGYFDADTTQRIS